MFRLWLLLSLLTLGMLGCTSPDAAHAPSADSAAIDSLRQAQHSFDSLRRSDLDEAERHAHTVMRLSQQLGDSAAWADAHADQGFVSYYRNEFPAALDAYLSALQLYVAQGDSADVGEVCYWIGKIHRHERNYDLSLAYSLRAMRLTRESGDLRRHSSTLNSLGNLYMLMNRPEEAYLYYSQRPALEKAIGDMAGYATAYNDVGIVLTAQGRTAEGLRHQQRALAILDSIQFASRSWYLSKVYAGILNSVAEASLAHGQPAAAAAYAQRGLDTLSRTQGRKEQAALYLTLSKAYEALGDPRKALTHQQQYIALHDSLLNEENQSRVAQLEESFRVATKERQVAEVSAERNALQLRVKEDSQRLLAVIGASVLVLLLAGTITWVILARARLRRQREQFAAVIATEENERKRIAMELHDGLGQLLATARLHLSAAESGAVPEDKSLGNSLQLIDDACREVRGISHNLMPVALIRGGLERALRDLASRTSMGESLRVNLTMGGDTFHEPDSSTAVALYRIVQEIVANAIRHASPTEIAITLSTQEGRLSLTVQDNGKGTDVQRLASGKGIGWKNIQSRVALLRGQLHVDSQPGRGTLYRISLGSVL